MPRHISTPREFKWSTIAGKIVRVTNCEGISWFLPPQTIVNQRIHVMSLPNGTMSKMPLATLIGQLERGDVEISKEVAHATRR